MPTLTGGNGIAIVLCVLEQLEDIIANDDLRIVSLLCLWSRSVTYAGLAAENI